MKERTLFYQLGKLAVTFGFPDLPAGSISTQAESREPRQGRVGRFSNRN
jgi:hypothetical protein